MACGIFDVLKFSRRIGWQRWLAEAMRIAMEGGGEKKLNRRFPGGFSGKSGG
jgi:hypothetical protein